MSSENPDERNLERYSFLTPDSKRIVLTLTHLFDEINELARKDIRVLDEKSKIVAAFHKSLKSYCEATYGNGKLWEQVPEAQKLIGGSLENRPTITNEQFDDISNQVLDIISQLESLVASQR